MKILLNLLVITFFSIPVMAESVDGKAVLCSDVNKGFFFEGDNIVRIFRIYGMEVWDWEQSSYDEVGTHQIEWYYDGELYHLDGLTLMLNGMDVPCEFIKSKLDLKKRFSPMSFFENLEEELGN